MAPKKRDIKEARKSLRSKRAYGMKPSTTEVKLATTSPSKADKAYKQGMKDIQGKASRGGFKAIDAASKPASTYPQSRRMARYFSPIEKTPNRPAGTFSIQSMLAENKAQLRDSPGHKALRGLDKPKTGPTGWNAAYKRGKTKIARAHRMDALAKSIKDSGWNKARTSNPMGKPGVKVTSVKTGTSLNLHRRSGWGSTKAYTQSLEKTRAARAPRMERLATRIADSGPTRVLKAPETGAKRSLAAVSRKIKSRAFSERVPLKGGAGKAIADIGGKHRQVPSGYIRASSRLGSYIKPTSATLKDQSAARAGRMAGLKQTMDRHGPKAIDAKVRSHISPRPVSAPKPRATGWNAAYERGKTKIATAKRMEQLGGEIKSAMRALPKPAPSAASRAASAVGKAVTKVASHPVAKAAVKVASHPVAKVAGKALGVVGTAAAVYDTARAVQEGTGALRAHRELQRTAKHVRSNYGTVDRATATRKSKRKNETSAEKAMKAARRK